MRNKLKLIYKPFIIIAICIIAGYTFLNWFLCIKLEAISINEDLINIWIPFTLPWIPILIWLRPRIKLLNLKRKKGNLQGLYVFIAGFAIVAPTIIAQAYLETATGKLSQLNTVAQLPKQKATKYYTIRNCYIDKNHIGVQNSFDVSGKHNEYFNMNLFVVLPILNTAADTSLPDCVAWYGIKYQEQISNRLDDNEKEERFKQFANESQADFDQKNVNQFIYLDRIGNTNNRKGYIAAIKNNKRFSDASATVLIPVNEPFEARNGHKLAWIFGSFAIGALILFFMILIPKPDEEALQKFNSGERPKETGIKENLSIFLPKEGYFITPIIIDLNVLIFLIMVFSGLGFMSFKAVDLLNWGANFKPSTTNGEWWRLLTNIFLHAGFMHLFANMTGLLFVGILLEPRLGKKSYSLIYLVTGIAASLTSLGLHNATISVGASGAIFGLYGVFLALLMTRSFPEGFSKAFLTSTLIFVGYNLLMGLAGGIDNAAHIGGLLNGVIIGIFLSPRIKQETEEQSLL
jgi:rhomboid protease GluP